MKKLYISELSKNLDELDELLKSVDVVNNMEDCTDVLVVPGGMGAFSDIFKANELKKNLYLYNKNMYFSGLIGDLYKGHLEGYIDDAPSKYIHVESSIEDIKNGLEENEDGKTNNGQTR